MTFNEKMVIESQGNIHAFLCVMNLLETLEIDHPILNEAIQKHIVFQTNRMEEYSPLKEAKK